MAMAMALALALALSVLALLTSLALRYLLSSLPRTGCVVL